MTVSPFTAADVEVVARTLADRQGDDVFAPKFAGDHWAGQRQVYLDDARAVLDALAAATRSSSAASDPDPSLVLLLTDELRRAAEAGEPPVEAAQRVLTALTAVGRLLDPTGDAYDVCGALARLVRATVIGSRQEAVARAAYRAALAEAER